MQPWKGRPEGLPFSLHENPGWNPRSLHVDLPANTHGLHAGRCYVIFTAMVVLGLPPGNRYQDEARMKTFRSRLRG